MASIKRVAVIGAGPAGCIAVDALAQEKAFDVIRVFERKDRAGGTWAKDHVDEAHQYPNLDKIASRTSDIGLVIPEELSNVSERNGQYRFAETSIYSTLETNISAQAMAFSQEPFPVERTALNIQRHGVNSPFRHWKVMEKWVQDLLNRDGYQDFVSYNTWVELVQKDEATEQWVVTLRKTSKGNVNDTWWTETFDAIVVANGHYYVPWIPPTKGLSELEKNFPGTVEHSKAWRGPEKYRNKRVVVVGASISGSDISWSTADYAKIPLISVTRGKYHPYFGDWAFKHPKILLKPQIKEVISDRETDERTIFFEDGSKVEKVDSIIFGTGYTWTLPFLPQVTVHNNRIQSIYQHVFWRDDPTLTFVGATSSGFTFKVFEWQAVLAARFLAGRITLPSVDEQIQWERDRIAYKGEGQAFAALNPDFEDYFETVRKLAGEPTSDGKGRLLPKFEKWWLEDFEAGHLVRIAMWKKGNEDAHKRLQNKKDEEDAGYSRKMETAKINTSGSDWPPSIILTMVITDEIKA